MGILNKYNKKPLFEYDNNKKREFAKLRDLVSIDGVGQKNYVVHALFINKKSRFGEEPIIVTENNMVNAPRHLLDTVKDMREDEEVINLINNRMVAFKIYSYSGKNGDGYSVEWIEL